MLFGILAFARPGITLGALIILFGTYAPVDDVFALVAVLSGRTEGVPSWAMLLEDVIGIAAGFVTFFWPAITALALVGVIAVWAIVTGVFQVVAAIRLREEIRGEWLLVLSGLPSIAFGAILLIGPAAGALAVVRRIGAYAVAAGVWPIVFGFRPRSRLRRGALGVVPLPGEATEMVGHGARNAERWRRQRSSRDGAA